MKVYNPVRTITLSLPFLLFAAGRATAQVVDFSSVEEVGDGLIISLTGNIATIVFVLAVIVTGFLAAFNRIQWVWFFAVIFGAFLVFGAPAIVASLQGALS